MSLRDKRLVLGQTVAAMEHACQMENVLVLLDGLETIVAMSWQRFKVESKNLINMLGEENGYSITSIQPKDKDSP